MKAGRLWVVSELYYPEQTSTGYFLTHIAEGLRQFCDVSVICGQPTYSEHGEKAPDQETRGGVNIYRMRGTHFHKDRLVLRFVNLLTFMLFTAWFALRRFRKGDKLLLVTNPPTLTPILGLIARWKGVEASLLVHDLYPEVLAATGFLSKTSLGFRVLARLFSASFALFGTIIVLGRDMAELARSKVRNTNCKIEVIPNWGDPEEIRPIPKGENSFLREHDIHAPFVIQFSGNIGRTHDVETILGVAQRLAHRSDILFLFVGYGGKAALIEHATVEGGLRNVRFLARQPREKLGPMLACPTATIISFVSEMKGISVPSRMYNVLAAGTPIIAMADLESELARTVRETESGWVLQPGDEVGLEALVTAICTPEGQMDAKRFGENGRSAVLRKYTLDIIVDKYRLLFA